jgi:O-methyltransferase
MRPQAFAGKHFRSATQPVLKHLPIEHWPGPVGAIFDIEVPRRITASPTKTAASGSNIKIIFDLLARTSSIEGDVAECGVFRGSTLIPMALYLKQHGIRKNLFGFDSFEGFDESVNIDIRMGGRYIEPKRVGGLSDTSYEQVYQRIVQFGLSSTVTLVKGYFRETLSRFKCLRMSFVYLDCDLYQSYKECLEFFYPLLSTGGTILFDEYNDPPWPGCNKAVDEFLEGKPEKPVEIVRDNFQKWYISKQ